MKDILCKHELPQLSERQARRLLARFRKKGAAGMAHGNRGKRPPNKLGDSVRERTEEPAESKYSRFNTLHFSEMLGENGTSQVSGNKITREARSRGFRIL